MGDVIPPTGPRSSNSLRPCLSLVNEIRRCTRVQGSTVRTQISMAQGEKDCGMVDSAFSGIGWLANCYFTHDSSEFPTPHDELASTSSNESALSIPTLAECRNQVQVGRQTGASSGSFSNLVSGCGRSSPRCLRRSPRPRGQEPLPRFRQSRRPRLRWLCVLPSSSQAKEVRVCCRASFVLFAS